MAAGDRQQERGQDLTAYYNVDGNPPGVWLGKGAGVLGVQGQVSSKQMRALFGEGRHPDAERIEKDLIAEGKSPKEAMAATQLGRRFPQFIEPDDDGWREAIEAAYAGFERDHGRKPEPGVERELIRWNVAGELLTAQDKPADDRSRRIFLASRGAEQRDAVAGFDLTFTPVKSISTLWAVADDQVHEQITQAHEASWREAIEWIEEEAAVTRVGRAGIAQEDTNGLAMTAFRHHDSRAGDPNLHTHVLVSGKVQGRRDGKWRALDGRVIYSMSVAASERYNTNMERELQQRLGVSFVAESRGLGKRPVREIDGVPLGLRDEFSSRRVSVEAAYADLLDGYRAQYGHEPPRKTQMELMQQATLATRQGKQDPVKLSEQRLSWRQAATRLLGEGGVPAMVAKAISPLRRASSMVVDVGDRQVDLRGKTIDELGVITTEIVSETRATWTRWNIEAEAQRLARVITPAGENSGAVAKQITESALAKTVIRIAAPELNPVPFIMRRRDGSSIYHVHGGTKMTSTAILNDEEALLAGAREHGGFQVEEQAITDAIAARARAGVDLNAGQVEVARRFAAGGHRIEIAIGPAGAGKTTAMRPAVAAIESAGGRVIALGPSAVAAKVLGNELGVRGETLHKFMAAHTKAGTTGKLDDKYRLDEKTVVVVDEAGMAGTRRLARLLAMAQEHGAAIRLLGDPHQLSAIEAGGALKLIADRVGAAQLIEVHRFTNPSEAAASLQARIGDHRAIDFYVAAGRVSTGSRPAMIEDMFANWWTDQKAGKSSLMIAESSADVVALNTRARLHRVEAGQVTKDGHQLHDGTTAGVGDAIVTRANDRRIHPADDRDQWVRNGDIWQVHSTDRDGSITAVHSDGHQVVLPADYVADRVELAYATTVHRTQGMTVQTTHMLAEKGTDRESFYTGTTRGKDSNRVYAVSENLIEAEAEQAPDRAIAARHVLAAILDHEGAEKSATQTIEDTLNYQASLARLVPEFEDARDRILDPERISRLEDVVRQRGGALAEGILNDPAWPALGARLARWHDAGTDPGDILVEAIDSRELNTAESIAQVLHWRIEEPETTRRDKILPWLAAVDPEGPGDTNVRAWLVKHGELITDRVDHLLADAKAGRPKWLTDDLRCPEDDPIAAARWEQAARTVVAYRDQYQIPDDLELALVQPGRAVDHHKMATKALATMKATHDTDQTTEAVSLSQQQDELRQRAAKLREAAYRRNDTERATKRSPEPYERPDDQPDRGPRL